jgi:hypothetical protein
MGRVYEALWRKRTSAAKAAWQICIAGTAEAVLLTKLVDTCTERPREVLLQMYFW